MSTLTALKMTGVVQTLEADSGKRIITYCTLEIGMRGLVAEARRSNGTGRAAFGSHGSEAVEG